jgi:hypothetical protein
LYVRAAVIAATLVLKLAPGLTAQATLMLFALPVNGAFAQALIIAGV